MDGSQGGRGGAPSTQRHGSGLLAPGRGGGGGGVGGVGGGAPGSGERTFSGPPNRMDRGERDGMPGRGPPGGRGGGEFGHGRRGGGMAGGMYGRGPRGGGRGEYSLDKDDRGRAEFPSGSGGAQERREGKKYGPALGKMQDPAFLSVHASFIPLLTRHVFRGLVFIY